MQARISGLDLAEEQRALVEVGIIMTHPDRQFPWMPQPKTKAKAAPVVPPLNFVGEDDMAGAMTDACKRRFLDEEDPDYSTALDEFEVVQAINEFNAGGASVVGGMPMAAGLGPYGSGAMDEIPRMASDPQVAEMGMIPPGFPTSNSIGSNYKVRRAR